MGDAPSYSEPEPAPTVHDAFDLGDNLAWGAHTHCDDYAWVTYSQI
jgi:hypothetical protein